MEEKQLKYFHSRKIRRIGMGHATVPVAEHSLIRTLLKFRFIPLLENCCYAVESLESEDIQGIEAIQ